MKRGCIHCIKEIIFQIAVIIAGINLALLLNIYFKSEYSLIAIIIITLAIAVGIRKTMVNDSLN